MDALALANVKIADMTEPLFRPQSISEVRTMGGMHGGAEDETRFRLVNLEYLPLTLGRVIINPVAPFEISCFTRPDDSCAKSFSTPSEAEAESD